MTHVEKTVEVERPVEAVYQALSSWSWEPEDGAELGVTERVDDEVIAWRGEGEGGDTWTASLIALSPRRTRVDLDVEHDPHGLRERAADAFGALERRIADDLTRFKTHVESSTPPPDAP